MHGPNGGAGAACTCGAHPDHDHDGDADSIFAEINITPLVDVVLVLLIIFMVTSSAMVDAVREGRLDVTLPQAGSAAAATAAPDALVIAMDKEGRLFVHNGFVTPQQLHKVLQATHAKAPHTSIIVDADGALSHKDVVQVIDWVRAAGFATVAIGAEGTAP